MVTPQPNLGNYNIDLYAMEALRWLKESRGIARYVHTGLDEERKAFRNGDTIKLRRPQTFVARDESSVEPEAIAPGADEMKLDKFRHVTTKVKDFDTVFTNGRLMAEHIGPMVDAVGQSVEAEIYGLALGVGPFHTVGTPGVGDLTAARKIMVDNKAPMRDVANLHVSFGSGLMKSLLDLSAFTQHQGAGPLGVTDQRTGLLTPRYGFGNFHETTMPATHTPGAVTASAPKIHGDGDPVAKGTKTIIVNDDTLTGTVAVGDIITIDGSSYAITAAATAAANAISVALSRGLDAEVADDTAVTFTQTAKVENLAFHKLAFAYCMGPLPMDAPQQASALVRTATDPESGLSIRLSFWWDPKTDGGTTMAKVDGLFGVKVLDDRFACRIRS